MATLKSTDAWMIKIYPDDHPPPHFHVQTADGESLVDIATLEVSHRGANRRALKEALLWSAQQQATLARVWGEQNYRSLA
ncbi:MAG: DUF4160 domain-containing protein [Pseudomonas sp.]